MNTINFIKTAVKLLGAGLGGGATALAGAIGAVFIGDAAANVINEVLDYTVFDVENGYLKDHPERTNESAIKRMWRVIRNE